MAVKLKKLVAYRLFHRTLYYLIRMYSLTFRLKVVNEAEWMDYFKNGGCVLLCTWHQQFLAAIRYFKKYQVLGPSIIISRSADGDVIAGVAQLTGWYPVRGSSSRGGKDALKEMIDRLTKKRLAAHIMDGPRGPIGIVKPGAIRMASVTGAVIVPFYVSADRTWYAKSWDRFLIPKPFAKVTLRFDTMIHLPELDSEETFEQMRKKVEDIMVKELQG